MIENFTPTASIVIFGAIALAVIILYNFCKMILMNDKTKE